MSLLENIKRLNRCAGMTRCEGGYNDLSPVILPADARAWERCEDFVAQSYRPPPLPGTSWPAWCPAYRQLDASGREKTFADFLVFDLHGYAAHPTALNIFGHDLAGMVHPTKSDTVDDPRCRLILLLNRPVNMETYGLLWNRINSDMFAGALNPSHADGRQRFDMPRSSTSETRVWFCGRNPLCVDASLASTSCDETTLEKVSWKCDESIWPEFLPPVDR